MNKLISTVSPHFSTKRDTTHIMLDVILALCPTARTRADEFIACPPARTVSPERQTGVS